MHQITNCDFPDYWAESWEREIQEVAPPEEKEVDYEFIDRLFERLEEMKDV